MVSEIDVARFITAKGNSLDSCTAFLEQLSRVEWTEPGCEPDIVKALVLNQLFCDDHAKQRKLLVLLLRLVLQMSAERLKKLLRRESDLELFELCLARYNELHGDSSKAQLLKSAQDDKNDDLKNCDITKVRFPCLLFTNVQVIGQKAAI